MTILDLLTLLSYIALNVDIVFQTKRIYQTKSSLTGMSIRYAAILIILIKIISMSDVPLISGQGFIVLTFSTYFALALPYLAKRKRAHQQLSFEVNRAVAALRGRDSACEWPVTHFGNV